MKRLLRSGSASTENHASITVATGNRVSAYLRRKTVAFTVRIWAEYLEQVPPSWRGEVICVDRGERVAFGSIDRLVEFLQSEVTAALGGDREERSRQGPRPG